MPIIHNKENKEWPIKKYANNIYQTSVVFKLIQDVNIIQFIQDVNIIREST